MNAPDLTELSSRIRGEVLGGRHDRMLYATDASIYQVEPLAVVAPRDADDVRAAVAFCAERGLPLLSRGGGTSLAGQVVNEAVVLDFSRWCTRILEVDRAARLARVEPGVVLDDLNRRLAADGLMFGPDVATAAHATIGGMIGNNSAGAHSILYGRTVEHVEAMGALLADGTEARFEAEANRDDDDDEDGGRRGRGGYRGPETDLARRVIEIVRSVAGEIRERYPRTRRRVNGYNLDVLLEQAEASSPGTIDRVNLASLLCGSEGTLAVMIEATVRLVEAPRAKGLSILGFPDVDAALRSLVTILATSPAAVELIDDVVIDLARGNTQCARHVELLPRLGGGTPGAVLYVEYFGDDAASIADRQAGLEDALRPAPAAHYRGAEEMERAWTLRRSGEPLLHGLPGARKPITFVEDLAVAAERLPEFVPELRDLLARHGTRAAFYAHASVGCLHVRPLIDQRDAADRAAMEAILGEATDLVRRYGGALSGEHGDGRLRSPLLERFYGPRLVEAFRAVKGVFDPEHRLNPGNIVSPPPLASHLRLRPQERDLRLPVVETHYRFRPEHGFAEAVERCNGAGVCRKTTGGAMCPSYRATRRERHSTRGRGNALRLAISGQLPESDGDAAWTDPETLATLDLCLSCKACKSECPSNVDLAKLKSEYLAQGYRRGRRVPIAHRLIARVRGLNALASRAPGLVDGLARSAPGRAIASRALGVDPRRTPPPFGRSVWRRRGPVPPRGERPAVVLFADCFTAYGEAHIALAAIRVLEGLGYEVIVPRTGCCGRPAISLGLLDRAVRTIERTAGVLLAAAEAPGVAGVVGLEPSCVSAIGDDWLDLDVAVDGARLSALAARTRLVEAFIEERASDHPRPMGFETDASGPPVLLHGHCHQQALWGANATASLLRRAAGERLTVLDAGCCGMAGAFGFAREHYELSMEIAELSLLPALRAAPDAIIVANGTSCRHQIRDGAGRAALHPVELLGSRAS